MSLFSLHDDRGPDAAVEISSHRIAAVRLERRSGGAVIAAHAIEPLPPGALVPALMSANIQHRPEVARALGRALERVGKPRRIGLVIADPAARVSLVKFQHVPGRAAELDQLIRWQLKKASPFPIEEAQLSYALASTASDGQEFLVTTAQASVIAEYESLCAEAGALAGLVDVSTTSVVNAVLGAGAASGDRLLVNMAPEWTSLVVLREQHVALVRTRAADGDESLADLVHQTAMYYEDRLSGTGFAQVLLCGVVGTDGARTTAADRVRRELEERLGTPVSAIDPTQLAPLADGTRPSALLADALAPVVGLLMRQRKVRAA